MKSIFAATKVTISGTHQEDNLCTVGLDITYKDEPARNFDYTHFDGRNWSNIYSAKDGRGIIEISNLVNPDKLKIKAEYVFEGEANIDRELADVMETSDIIYMPDCNLSLEKSKDKPSPAQINASMTADATDFMTVACLQKYTGTIVEVENAIRLKNYDSIQKAFTREGYDMFRKLIQYGNARIIRKPEYNFIPFQDGIKCRSIPMSFSFAGNQRTFVEDVVFNINKEGLIDGLAFSLNQAAVDDIMNRTSWNNDVRKVLINFLEDYKTAYALKRYDYIKKIFSDDALIITGSVLKEKPNPIGENGITIKKGLIKYTHQTKQEYMKRLEHIFSGSEYINLCFADNEIRKSGVGGEVYGIQIHQDYFSNNYGDTGYLFLMVDLNHPKDRSFTYVHGNRRKIRISV